MSEFNTTNPVFYASLNTRRRDRFPIKEFQMDDDLIDFFKKHDIHPPITISILPKTTVSETEETMLSQKTRHVLMRLFSALMVIFFIYGLVFILIYAFFLHYAIKLGVSKPSLAKK